MLDSDLLARVGKDVERSMLRARNGVAIRAGDVEAARVGATPKDIVWQRDRAELWRYRGGPVRYDPPILIVHSLVSRSYILDLRPGNSASTSSSTRASTCSCSTGASPTSATPTTASRPTSTSTCRARSRRRGG